MLTNKDLHLNQDTGPKTSSHKIDFGAFTLANQRRVPWIVKFNKHEGLSGVDASILEVAFSEVASLFIRPGLTPPTHTVHDEDNAVIGVASRGVHVQIQENIERGTSYYSYLPESGGYHPLALNETEETPDMVQLSELEEAKKGIHFLNDMPPDFFHLLMEKHRRGEIQIDMDSLASILTASYVLEEDDLHKGNIGFYVTDMASNTGTTKQFTFFKIDHDLMFMDSVMSRRDMRLANLFYDENAFKITARDLNGFPDLQDSGNHYWPTKSRWMVKGTKAYGNAYERQAFACLKSDPEFIQSKWRHFLKYSVMPMELITQSLSIHLDPINDIEKLTLIKNSVSTRLAQLKQTLLASDDFMAYFKQCGCEEQAKIQQEIQTEIQAYMTTANISITEQEDIVSKIDHVFNQLKEISISNLSLCIKEMTWNCYSFSTKRRPSMEDLRWAEQQYTPWIARRDEPNAFKYACIIIDLIENYEQLSDENEILDEEKRNISLLKDKWNHGKNRYLSTDEITTYEQFTEAANKIRACDLPLKQQKRELLAVLTNAHLGTEDLERLKVQLDNPIQDDPALSRSKKLLRHALGNKAPKDPSLKFINQLRSNLWFIRDLRGTYGTTATSTMMIEEIDRQLSLAATQTARGPS